jgi:hypothetical protein
MKPTEKEIEEILRSAPRPNAPAGLKDRLLGGMRLPAAQKVAPFGTPNAGFAGWVRRWWPALAPGAVSLACAAVITAQQAEIRNLKETLPAAPPSTATSAANSAETRGTAGNVAPGPNAADADELARLRALVAQLTTEVKQLEQLRGDNGRLRSQLAAPPAGTFSAEETQAMEDARGRAQEIMCVNNMKQMGLANKVWALDNKDTFSPDMLSMSNELSTPKILVCPSDTSRQVAKDFSSYTDANCSYEYLAPTSADTEPTRVMFRCPIHGSITLTDGSVQKGVAKTHPENFIERNGRLYYEPRSQQ